MAVADELVVALRTEGAKETRDDLEDVQEQFTETADTAEESSSNLTAFAMKFQGAMKVAIAGLAIAAVGLLAQIPAVGMVMAGLGAIIEGLLFQVNQFIQPLAGPLSDAFFKLSNAIFKAEGILGDFLGAATLLGSFLLVLKAAALAGSGLAAAILGAGAAIVSLPVIVGAAIAALLAFFVAYITNWKGTRDKTDAILAKIGETVKGLFNKFLEWAGSILGPFVQNVKEKFADVKQSVVDWADDLAERARTWGRNLIDRFIGGIKSKIQGVRDALSDVTGSIGGAIGIGGTTGAPRAAGRLSRTSAGPSLSIDGRSLTRTTGRYDSDRLTRRNI